MYEIRFGYGWKYVVQTGDKASAVRVAEALTFKGWGVRVTDPDGVTVPWRHG